VKNVPNDPILTQFKRIKGQLEGIIAMYEDEQTCVDVVRQVIAARNSLGSVAQKLLSGEATKCTKERRVEDLQEILREVFRY
jgi:CsoR family transcriptional regulator, copper-sensing transcriptional repressor